MKLTDSHCHLHMLDLEALGTSLDELIRTTLSQGLTQMLCVGTRLEDYDHMMNIALKYPNIDISVGLHPNEIVEMEPSTDEILALASNPKVVAIGETGLDYYRTPEDTGWQQSRFRTHIQAAHACHKPLIIHTRQAAADTLRILKEEKADRLGGVFHCFTEDWETAEAALALGFYISFSGIITFKNAQTLHEVAKRLPLEHMLIETDAPFLAPMPYRGKTNQPLYVKYVAETIAQLKGMDAEEVATKTTENYFKLFKP